jgi:hypothetical protein
LLFATHFTSAQAFNYSYLTIPEDLKENANAVIRLDDTYIEMASPHSMHIKRHLIVTVMNKYGDGTFLK